MATSASSASKTVLAVDDEPGVLSALTRVLKLQDYEVTAAPSAEAGLELVRAHEYAVILSDNMMPGMKGLEFLTAVMQHSPDSRRILVTGYTDLQQALDAFNHGILHRYIQKPWELHALLAVVRDEWNLYAQSYAKLGALAEADGLLKQRSDMIEQALNLLKKAGAANLVDGREQPPERKLTVILHGDVVSFSRLMGADHESTLAMLQEVRDFLAAGTARFRGRIVNAVGDAFLAEFASAVDAVACACGLQQDLGARNSARAESSRMRVRLGINVGDVLHNGGDLYGDAVNIAARIQALAAPEGICITDAVYRLVRGRLPYTFKPLGPQTLKNIAESVEIYTVVALEK